MMRKPLVWLLAGLLLSVALIVYGQWRSSPAAVESSAAPTELPVVTQSAPAPSLSPAESPKVVIAPAPPESITIPELGFTLEVRAETTYEMATAYRRSHPAEKATRMLYASGFYTASWPSDWRGGARYGLRGDRLSGLPFQRQAARFALQHTSKAGRRTGGSPLGGGHG